MNLLTAKVKFMPQDNQAQTLLSVESLINSYNLRLTSLTKEMREHNAMLTDLLENNEDYKKIADEHQKLTKEKTISKKKVLVTPSAAALVGKIKDYKLQLADIKKALSDYLSQYISLAGTNQIETADGILLEIVHTAKLVKKKA